MSYTKVALALSLAQFLFLSDLQLRSISDSSIDEVNKYLHNATLLVIAHPDDETMFFGPLIINLVRSKKSLDILCLSNGSSGGHGSVRLRELERVTESLGSNVSLRVIEDDDLVDGLESKWDISKIEQYIEDHLKSSTRPIKTVITFDSGGVSGHPNHISLHKAVSVLSHSGDLKVNYYYLRSVGILRKYISFLDVLLTRLLESITGREATFTVAVDIPGNRELRELLNKHESQMVWFRKLYMVFSRYMFINELTT